MGVQFDMAILVILLDINLKATYRDAYSHKTGKPLGVIYTEMLIFLKFQLKYEALRKDRSYNIG